MHKCKHCGLPIQQGQRICYIPFNPDTMRLDEPIEYLHHNTCCREYKKGK